jgi:hypothetical protein
VQLRYKEALNLIKAGTDVNFQISHETPLGNLTQACYRSFAKVGVVGEPVAALRQHTETAVQGATGCRGLAPSAVGVRVPAGWRKCLEMSLVAQL